MACMVLSVKIFTCSIIGKVPLSFHFQDCASSPCLHGGSCVDLIDKYACFCQDGYTGKTCENDIDVCKDAAFNVSLCFNGATCLDGEGSNFTCR